MKCEKTERERKILGVENKFKRYIQRESERESKRNEEREKERWRKGKRATDFSDT